MRVLPFLFSLSLLCYAVTVLLLVPVPAAIWARRASWRRWEPILVVAPFCLWAVMVMIDDSDKTLSNLFAEPILLGIFVGVVAWLRIVLATRWGAARCSLWAASSVVVGAGVIWWLMPLLHE